MKTKIAAALSIAGVLVAGSAAALVNAQVLETERSTSTATTPGTTPGTTLGTTPAGSSPTTTIADSTRSSIPTTTAPVTGATATQAVYRVGDAGTVTLDTAGGVLTVVAASPSPGWIVHEVEVEGPGEIDVEFLSATTKVEFRAGLLFGVVTTSVESYALGGAGSGAGTVGGGTATATTFDDDHDDDHDSDDHGDGDDDDVRGDDHDDHGDDD